MSPNDRQSLREHYRARRNALNERDRRAAEAAIAAHIVALLETRAADTTIFAYRAHGGEVALDRLFEQSHRNFALPRITSTRTMAFHRWRGGEALRTNRFGIGEPAPEAPRVQPQATDLMLVPLVAWDRRGTRLGMGGGFYDRYLHGLAEPPALVGVAFACQEHSEPLPRESWDVPLTSIVSETGIVAARASE